MSVRPKVVFFDLGKVLFDFDFDRFFRRVMGEEPPDEQLIAGIGALANRYESGLIESGPFIGDLAKFFPGTSPEETLAAWQDIFTPIEPHIESLRMLRERGEVRLGVISNTNEIHFDYLAATWPIFDGFDYLALSFREKALKPEPEIYQAALRGIDARAGDCLFLDDREENVRAAVEIGLHAVQILEAGQVGDELHLRRLL